MFDSHKNWLHRTIDRAMLYFSYHEVIDGLWVGASVDKKQSAQILGTLREALALIRVNDPYRYRRVIGRLDKIFVHPLSTQGQYVPELRRCIISTSTAEEGDVMRIAITIIHEATHAELFDRGIGYGVAVRQRVEEVCARQELMFGRKFPGTADLLEETEYRMTLPAETWSNEADLQRDIDYLEHDAGIPKWVLNCILKLRDWRMKRARARETLKSEAA